MTKPPTFLSLVGPGSPTRQQALTDLANAAVARLRAQADHIGPGAGTVLGDPCAAAMAYALCDDDEDSAAMLVADLLEAGLSVEDLCRDHLAPAARRLGLLWDRDRLPFTEVALATARIQAILRRLPKGRGHVPMGKGVGAVFAAVPGELHTLGVMMAADLFRRNGWDVSLFVGLTHDDLLSRLTRDDRPVVGLSCSGDHSYPALRRLLAALGNSRPEVQVLLSGAILANPDRVAALPVPVVPVGDLSDAEAEMDRIRAALSARKGRRPARGQGSSVA